MVFSVCVDFTLNIRKMEAGEPVFVELKSEKSGLCSPRSIRLYKTAYLNAAEILGRREGYPDFEEGTVEGRALVQEKFLEEPKNEPPTSPFLAKREKYGH